MYQTFLLVLLLEYQNFCSNHANHALIFYISNYFDGSTKLFSDIYLVFYIILNTKRHYSLNVKMLNYYIYSYK